MEGLLRHGDDRGDGLVDVVLFCCGDSFEDDLRWKPKLRAFVDLAELDDVAKGIGVTLFKTVETLRGAFFFSTSAELKTKVAGGGGSGPEMIDSNTSLSSTLTLEHFFAVSAIRFERTDLACTCVSGRFLVQRCGRATCIATFATRDTICSDVKLNVLLGCGGEACFRMEAKETWFWTTLHVA